jgi:hypothetical protein
MSRLTTSKLILAFLVVGLALSFAPAAFAQESGG